MSTKVDLTGIGSVGNEFAWELKIAAPTLRKDAKSGEPQSQWRKGWTSPARVIETRVTRPRS
jgi:hypothetical protein